MHDIFRFILFYRITYDPLSSIKIKITMFDRLGFMFVQRCIVAKDMSVKEKHFSDNLILIMEYLYICRQQFDIKPTMSNSLMDR